MSANSSVQLVGSIDQGTSSSRFIVFDRTGQNVGQHQIECAPQYPQPGWVEHSPDAILKSVLACITSVMAELPASTADSKDSKASAALPLRAVGITNQRETTIVWDKTSGQPLHAAIVWSDTRTKALCESLVAQTGSADHFRPICGLPISTYFSAMKLRWLLDNSAEVKAAVKDGRALFGTVDSWLIWQLTGGVNGGVHVTDVSNASRTMLMNINTLKWDKSVCDLLGIPMSILPRICSNAEVYGTIKSGPLAGVPIAGCLGDQQAALLGQLCVSPGSVKNTYGTGCFMLMNTATTPIASRHGLLTTVAFQLGPNTACQYALEGSVAVAGSAVQWLRDSVKLISKTTDINTYALEKPDSGGIYFVPAFSGLLSPYWREDARGVIVGLTHATGRAEICRATLEAACYQTREVLDAMQSDAGDLPAEKRITIGTIKVDGGMSGSELLCQFQSDILGVNVSRAVSTEATAAGAAYAAGLAVGVWTSIDDLIKCVSTREGERSVFEPKMSAAERSTKLAGWKRAVTRSFGWEQTATDTKHGGGNTNDIPNSAFMSTRKPNSNESTGEWASRVLIGVIGSATIGALIFAGSKFFGSETAAASKSGAAAPLLQ